MREDVAPAMLWPVGEIGEARVGEAIQIVAWNLHGREEEAEALCGELSAEERARAGRFVFRRDWRRYVMAHAGMRKVLGACVGRQGDAIVLGRGRHGKPHVVGEEGLGFNLTHSENLAVLAVARGIEVGVDVEWMREDRDPPVGQLSVGEQAYFEGLRGSEVGMGFYRCWTRKEALLKGVGVGLMGELGDFTALPGRDRAVVSGGASGAVATLGGWRVRELAPAVGYMGCLATPGEGFAARCVRLG